MNVQNGNKPTVPPKQPIPTSVFKANLNSRYSVIKTFISKILSLIVELAATILFALAYPFAVINSNPKSLSPSNKKVTILVHGFLHNRTAWAYLKTCLERCRDLGPVFTVNLGHPFHKIGDYTKLLENQIKSIQKMSPNKELVVDLVGHSMGGLVCCEYAVNQADNDPAQIKNVVTIASPLKGTKVAKLAPHCECANEMDEDSEFTVELNRKMSLRKGTKFSHLIFNEDLISPNDRSYSLPENSKEFSRLGHLSCLLSPKVADYVIQCLRSKPVSDCTLDSV